MRYQHQAHEKAAQGGFVGPYGTKASRVFKDPKKGPFTTISLEKALQADQFFRFHKTSKRSSHRRIRRRLLLNGQNMGIVEINLPPGDDEWLCPYFEPTTRTLRFRKQDGADSTHVVELYSLAQSKYYQPLLALAQAEGLLKKIPAGSMSSLDLGTILESGYYCQTTVTRSLGRLPSIEPYYRVSALGTLPRLWVNIGVAENRQTVRSFPYVDDNQRLRLWNVDENKPFRLLGRGVIDGALPAERVRTRSPKLFSWAQHLGYWSDVEP